MPIRFAPDVASLTQDDHPSLATHLEQALNEERENKIQCLIASKDWADFEKRRGEIMGLMSAIALCKSVNRKLQA